MRIIIGTLFVLLQSHAASAQPAPAVAFRNVSLSPMDREHVESDQTVLVRGDRIVAVGATGQVPIPAGATVIDGAGHHLLPGLTDAHVHLEAWEGSRAEMPRCISRPA